MRHNLSRLVLLALVLCIGTALADKTYTVKVSGGDYNNFAATTAAIPATLTENITFLCYSGVYTGANVNLSSKTTGSYTITYKAAPGENVVFNASSYAYGFYGSSCNNVKIEGLTIYASSYAIYLASYCSGWRVENCFLRAGSYGFYATSYCHDDSLIGNKVFGNGASYGIYMQGQNTSTRNMRWYIANNMVWDWTNTGIYVGNHENTELYYNTSHSHRSYSGMAGCYDNYGYNTVSKNNIWAPTWTYNGEYAYRKDYGGTLTAAYNCYWVDPTNGIYVNTYNATRVTWAQWTTTYGYDLGTGVNQNPQFAIVNSDLHLKSTSPCIGAGTPVGSISKDIDGDDRDGSTPCIGADEFVPADPLAGTYTIKQDGSGDFKSFSAALSALAVYGVGGDVTFDVYAGTYTEALNIANPGNAQYRVTFQAHEATDGAIDNVVLNAGGASYAVQLTDCQKLRFRNLQVSNFTSWGFYLGYASAGTDTCLIEGCTISGPQGIFLAQGADYDSIVGNYIRATSSYGIQLTTTTPYKYYNVIANNSITGWISQGIYSYYTYYLKLLHNTIYSTSGSYAFGSTYDYNLTQLNNIFYAPSYAYYNGSTTIPDVSNYNCFKVHNQAVPYSSLIYYSGARSLASWRSSYSRDQQGIEADPLIASVSNPHLKGISPCKDAGTDAGIAVDIDRDSRPQGLGYDIGCDEFVPGDPLSGTKTIKQDGSGDYTSIGNALGALQVYGQSGNVTFEVYEGTYAEPLNLQGLGNGAYWVTFKAADAADAPQNVVLDAAGQSYAVQFVDNRRIAFRNFKVQNFTTYGFYLQNSTVAGTDTVTIAGCDIVGPNGIYVGPYCDNDSLLGNRISVTSSYGIYLNGTSSPYNRWNVVANNMVSTTSSYALFMNYHQYSEVYYNSLYAPSGTGFYNQYGYLPVVMKNNILIGSSTGYAHYWGETYPSNTNYNNNCYWAMSGTNPIYHSSYGNMPLTTWQSWNGSRDLNSIQANPQFISAPTNLHITSASPCFEKATPITGWAVDFDGDARDAVKPDIGADEVFTDISVSNIVVPSGDYPVGTTVTPRVEVKNLGGSPATFNLFFRGFKGGTQVYTATIPNVVMPGGTTQELDMPADWTLSATGNDYMSFAWHSLMPDDVPGNDQASKGFRVGNVDAGVEEIQAPLGNVVQGTTVYPRVKLHNYGDFNATFDLTFTMDDGTDAVELGAPVQDAEVYNQTEQVTVAAGADYVHTFATGYGCPNVGTLTTHVELTLAGDTDPTNDFKDGSFTVIPPTMHDVGVTEILRPAGTVAENTPVFPKMKVKNHGAAVETFNVRCIITDGTDGVVFNAAEQVSALAIGEEREFTFTANSWTATTQADYSVRCTTELDGDWTPGNDMQSGAFSVGPAWTEGWAEVKSLPGPPSNKPMKDGAWLALGPDNETDAEVIYAAKGNKATDFFKYYPMEDTWLKLGDIPETEDGKRKPPSKGTDAVSDGEGVIYMTRGNNMLGFWKYVVAEDSWKRAEEDVPLGNYKKKVKGGNDMVYVVHNDTGYVYLLKGQRTEFYRFNTLSGKWETREEVPYQTKQKYDKGSFLVYDNANTIYAHQAKVNSGTNHYMFAFDLVSQTWDQTAKKGIPVYAKEGDKTKKKKVADGAAGAWMGDKLYATKGGNTQSFFKYTVDQDTWTELDNIPDLGSTLKKKRIKAGGDLVAFSNVFFAFKGNKTYEFWRYMEPTGLVAARPERSGVMAGNVGVKNAKFELFPNPLVNGYATLRYSLPVSGPLSVTVFDIAGRSVVHQTVMAHRTGAVSLDLRRLSSGVYLVRLDADNFTQTQKLVVQK